MDTDSPRLRLSILAVICLSLFGALFARLWYLQVMVADKYQVEASANRVRTVAEEAPRGRILDVNGRVIVDNKMSLVVTIDPYALKKQPEDVRNDLKLRVATKLTEFGIPTKVSAIDKRLADPQYPQLQPIPIAIDIPQDLYLYFSERSDDFPTVAVQRQSVRQYHPNLANLAHVLGYVGRVSPDELLAKQGTKANPKPTEKPYQPDSSIGKSGIEKQFEDDLRGVPGLQTIEVNAKQNPIRVVSEQAPQPGSDVYLTINVDVQKSAEDALDQQMNSLRGGHETGNAFGTNAPAGSAVTLDPSNGNVVAMASFPTYDPAEFVNGISSDRYAELKGDDPTRDPFSNRAMQGQYAPGSTFKLVTATAALSNGLINGNTSYRDGGVYRVMGCKVGSTAAGCSKRNAGGAVNGTTAMAKSLTVSSDVFYYWLGDRFWTEGPRTGIQDTARAYGLGVSSGIPLPFEQDGFIPDSESLKAKFPKADPFGEGNNVDTAIGQGYVLVTPLQLANVYATFANGGTVYQPNIVTKVVRAGGDPTNPNDVIRTVEPVVKGHIDLPANVRDPILQGLLGVPRTGTAAVAFHGFDFAAFSLAGKTGTAQVNGKADTSLFAAFGPIAPGVTPNYVTTAVLEEAGFGADAAAPVVRHVFETISGQTGGAVVPVTSGGAN
ncbi:MAG: penicillin-binding protein 2 [Actinomycetes bacterium]